MPAVHRVTLPLVESPAAPRQQESLDAVKKRYGVVPNTYRAMANEPALVDTYLYGMAKLFKESGFTPAELDVVFLTISFENGCEYCVAAHSFTADTQSKLNPDVTNAIREGNGIGDPKLRALSELTRAVLLQRGRPDADVVRAFLSAGYSERQLLDLVLAVALKTISNYTNHLFETPVDAMFKAREWSAFKAGVKVANFFRRTEG
jgi:uncharacterized peroxidase-related enzyme